MIVFLFQAAIGPLPIQRLTTGPAEASTLKSAPGQAPGGLALVMAEFGTLEGGTCPNFDPFYLSKNGVSWAKAPGARINTGLQPIAQIGPCWPPEGTEGKNALQRL